MRIFLAGATGVIGMRLIPLLHEAGHTVAGMTRSAEKAGQLEALGAEPVVCDVYDAQALSDAVSGFGAEMVMHQLTDLPDDMKRVAFYLKRNNRIRTEGTRNLLAAMRAAGAHQLLAQSIAFKAPMTGKAVAEHERMVLEAGGVVLRYGYFYGPGTFGLGGRTPHPRIQIDAAAARTVELLDAATGVYEVKEERG